MPKFIKNENANIFTTYWKIPKPLDNLMTLWSYLPQNCPTVSQIMQKSGRCLVLHLIYNNISSERSTLNWVGSTAGFKRRQKNFKANLLISPTEWGSRGDVLLMINSLMILLNKTRLLHQTVSRL